MPVKQVYGKRTKTKLSHHFLSSPDADEMLGLKPEEAVRRMEESQKTSVVARVMEIEEQLNVLTLNETETKSEGVELSAKKHTTRSRRRNTTKYPSEQQTGKKLLVTQIKAATKSIPDAETKIAILNPAAPNVVKSNVQVVIPYRPKTPTHETKNWSLEAITTGSSHMEQLPTPSPSPGPHNVYTAYVGPLLDLCDRQRIVSFAEWADELEPHFEITKIAEASFSEVYRLTLKTTVPGCAEESVLKLIALKTPQDAPLPSEVNRRERCRSKTDAARRLKREREERKENDVWKSEVAGVHGEVRLLQNLNHIPGFTNFRELTLLQGRPAASFGKAWKDWNKSRPRGKKSEFPDPMKKTSYEDTQLWAVVEMQDAGTDCEKVMERGGLSNVWEIWDVFWGVCLSVAKAEEGCRFEHRDLHLENVCIRSRTSKTLQETTTVHPLKRKLGFTNLETTVIDYTLSRADIITPSPRSTPQRRLSSSSTGSCLSTRSASSQSNMSSNTADIAYLDLNKDPGLFTGDADEEYQYEIYRYMRSVAYYNNPLKWRRTHPDETSDSRDNFEDEDGDVIKVMQCTPETPRRSPRKTEVPQKSSSTDTLRRPAWKSFHPKTNLLWAHFILYKLLRHVENLNNKPEHLSLEELMRNMDQSAGPVDAAKVQKKALRLSKILQKVEILLEPAALGKEKSLGSVKELVVLALEKGWLDPGDVVGEEAEEG
jgi:serine/threonine-protein kinase haspin